VFAADDAAAGVVSATAVTCTKCRLHFASRAALHAHIVDCGDYWRSLSERLTWVFVLRGSELPAQQSSTTGAARKQQDRRRGKFRWGSSASHESVRRQMQRMLIKQHVGASAAAAAASTAAASVESRRASARISSQKGTESPPPLPPPLPSAVEARDPRKPATRSPAPVLRRHVRRRAAAGGADATAADDTDVGTTAVKCESCSAPEVDSVVCGNHVDNADADRKEHENDDDDDDIDPSKHMCIYCSRQFTFMRALRRHVADGCSVRRDLIQRQEYIDDEWEAELRAAAGASRTSTDAGGDDAAGDASDGVRRSGGKRRRRCKNWGSSKSKSRRSARSSGDDADDSLFGWEDAYLSTWGKDEREDITRRGGEASPTADAAPAASSVDAKTTTTLAHLLTTDITINVSDRETRTSSDDLDTLVQRSISSSSTDAGVTTPPAATATSSVTTMTSSSSSSSGMSFAVKLELLTGTSPDVDDRPPTSEIADQSHHVGDVVLVVDEIPKTDADEAGSVSLDTSGSSAVSDAATPAADNDEEESGVDDVPVTATENGDTDALCRLKARRRRARRLTMSKRKKS